MGIKVTIKFIYYWPTALLGEESSSICNIILFSKSDPCCLCHKSVFQISHDMMAKGCKFSVFHQILIDAHILFSPKISPTRPLSDKTGLQALKRTDVSCQNVTSV